MAANKKKGRKPAAKKTPRRRNGINYNGKHDFRGRLIDGRVSYLACRQAGGGHRGMANTHKDISSHLAKKARQRPLPACLESAVKGYGVFHASMSRTSPSRTWLPANSSAAEMV